MSASAPQDDLSAAVDRLCNWSGIHLLVSSNGRGVPTIDLRVDYHSPAKGDLRAVGKVIKPGRQHSVAEAQVFDASGKLVASGRGVYLTPPKDR